MHICGLQKLAMVDFPGRIAATVFTGGCNLRCPFCHNSQLLGGDAEELMDSGALLDFLRKRQGVLDGVCITGGEPTLHADLPELLRSIRVLGYAIKLDTNGTNPQLLRRLIDEGLVDYVAMDVKNCPDRYAQTAGLPNLDISLIEQSMAFLLSDAVDYEFRTTVVSPLHDGESMAQISRWLEKISPKNKAKRFFIQPFVDRDTVIFSGLEAPETPEILEFQALLSPCAQKVEVRGGL
jgi:pyruvate formate lyase activating enzyme